MRRYSMALAIFTVAHTGLLAPVSVGAQEAPSTADTLYVDLDQARARALSASPSFLADHERVGAAEGALREARTPRFNPEADAEFPGMFRGSEPRTYEVLVSQRIEWAGQRGLRADAAQAGLDGAGAGFADRRLRLYARVGEAFYRRLAADRRLELVTGIEDLNARLLDAVEIQLREGEVSVMDANFAQIEAARSLGRVLAARREARSAALDLGRTLGTPSETYVVAVQGGAERLPDPSGLSLQGLLDAALGARPDLRQSDDQVREARTLARLARREAIPEMGVGAIVTGESDAAARVGLQLSVPLPLWDRNQGRVAQRDADARRSRLERDAVELQVRSEVADAYQAYLVASEEEELMSARVLGPARSNQELLDTAYREGEIDLPALVLLRNQLLDAETGYLDAWLARRQALVRLQAAVGDFDLDLEGS